MAKLHELNISAHYNIYNGHNNRNLRIYFSEPEQGVSENTGILLLIPGFGGNSQSNVYKKMRSQFADEHDLIVIQCDYFGCEFMQDANKLTFDFDISQFKHILPNEMKDTLKTQRDFEKLLRELSNYECTLPVTEELKECANNFNDMGFMQALDLLTAVYMVKAVLSDNKLDYNSNKTIAYGHSHGAFLAHLCNRMSPNEFALIIDNSAWLHPVYLQTPRYLFQPIGKMTLQIKFNYFAQDYQYDKELLDLSILYKDFNNQARIVAYHGVDDNLVDYKLKQNFFKDINNSQFNLITKENLDNEVFHSSAHGLNADFLKMFNLVLSQEVFRDKSNYTEDRLPMVIESKGIVYKIDFTKDLPIMYLDKKSNTRS